MSGPDWKTLLLRKKVGGPILPCMANIATIFVHDPLWRNVLAFDEMIGDIVSLKPPPWPKDLAAGKIVSGNWTEADTRMAVSWLARSYDFTALKSVTGDGLHIAAARTSLHPLRDWLNGLKWDRKSRVNSFLTRLAGADDTPYVTAVGKNFLIGAVARVMVPGSKVDTMPIFEGEQGIGKSTLIRELAGEAYYLEATIDMGSKDGYQVLRRKWIAEMGELDSITRTEVSRVKQFLSQRVDTYRPSYGHHTEDFYRQCVFVGTVNPNGGGYLKDETGARRFQPVLLRKIDLKKLRLERDQLWAEAVFRYRKCERWHMDDPKLIAAAKVEADDRRQMDPWEHIVGKWLATRKPLVQAKGVTTHDVLTDCLDFPTERLTRSEEMRCAAILRACGWTDVYRDCTYVDRARYYRRPNASKSLRALSSLVPTSPNLGGQNPTSGRRRGSVG